MAQYAHYTYLYWGILALLFPLYWLNSYLPQKFMLVEPGKNLKQLAEHSFFVQKAKYKYKQIAQALANQVFQKSNILQPLLEDLIGSGSEEGELSALEGVDSFKSDESGQEVLSDDGEESKVLNEEKPQRRKQKKTN